MVTMDAPVLRSRLVRKHFVEDHIILIHVIAKRTADDQGSRIAQVAGESRDCDIHDVITETPAIGPAAWNNPRSKLRKPGLDLTNEHITAEDAEPREARIIWVRRVRGAAPRQARRAGGEIDLDQVGDEDCSDVATVHVDTWQIRLEDEEVQQRRQLRSHGILAEDLVINGGTRPAVPVFIPYGDQALVEERISLPSDLDKITIVIATTTAIIVIIVIIVVAAQEPDLVIAYDPDLVIAYDLDPLPARCGINAHNLLVATEFADRNFQGHQMKVEAALGVLARVAKREKVEDGLDVPEEAVVALAGEDFVAPAQLKDRLRRVTIKLRFARYPILGGILAIVTLVVKGRGIPLVVRRDDAAAEESPSISSAVLDLRDPIGLGEILVGVIDVLNHTEIGLQNRVAVLETCVELELVAEGRTPPPEIVARSDMNLVENVVVKVPLIGTNPRLLERVDAKRHHQ